MDILNSMLRRWPACASLAVSLAACAQGSPTVARAPSARLDSAQLAIAARAEPDLVAQAARLGLGASDVLSLRAVASTRDGRSVARYDQLYRGFRVVGARASTSTAATGRVALSTGGLRPAITLTGEPPLGPDDALRIALADLAPQDPVVPGHAPRVERVVFPTALAMDLGDDPGAPSYVRPRGAVPSRVGLPAADGPYVWAYEVRTYQAGPHDGRREMTYVIDATRGSILARQDAVAHFDFTPAYVQDGRSFVSADTATGTGHGLMCGDVSLDVSQLTDDQGAHAYMLWDQGRGTEANRGLAYEADPGSSTTPYTGPTTGMQVWGTEAQTDGLVAFPYLRASHTFGDGQAFTGAGNERTANGETDAVDLMYAMRASWDFYTQGFLVTGIDGLGTSLVGQVHTVAPFLGWTPGYSDWDFSIYVMDATYPAEPGGHLAQTDVDLVGHEATHAFLLQFLPGYYEGSSETGSIIEGTCDFYGSLIEAMASQPEQWSSDHGARLVPDVGTDWRMGVTSSRGLGVRDLRHPSADGLSFDAWFAGMHRFDAHYTSGVTARALYYLAQGAPSDPSDPAYSPYLPAGMRGVGNDTAALVWMAALDYFNPGTSLREARDGVMDTVNYQLGAADSVLATAVQNAFAGVGVGPRAGEAEPPQVTFPILRDNDYFYYNNSERYRRSHIVLVDVPWQPKAMVLGSEDQRLTWSIPDPARLLTSGVLQTGGSIGADGTTWTPPHETGWYGLMGTSVADPLRRALGVVEVINLDADQDLEQDAIDMGSTVLAWMLDYSKTIAQSPYGGPWVADPDILLETEAITTVWPVEP